MNGGIKFFTLEAYQSWKGTNLATQLSLILIKTLLPTVFAGWIGLLAAGCTTPEPAPATPPRVAFYHWQSELNLDSTERTWQHRLRSQRLYLRLFDVDLEGGQVVPVGPVRLTDWPTDREVVPTVFIANRALTTPGLPPDTLADRILRRVTALVAGRPYPELQIDCDWTESSRAAYFQLLRRLRHRLPAGRLLSATIRLHQFKYPARTGVPPVDRGMLMAYNMGSLRDWADPNSILTPTVLAQYFQRDDYPLALDLALPLFRWGVIFRDGVGPRLINGLDTTTLSDTTRYERLERGRYRVRSSGYLQAYYLYQDDRLRLEWLTPDSLRAAARILRNYPWPAGWHLAFFHLDGQQLQYYDHAAIDDIPQLLAPHPPH